MAKPLHPEQIQELLAGYVLGNLSPEEAEILQELLAAQPELGHEVNQLQEVLATMPYSLPESYPSQQVRSSLMTATKASPSNQGRNWPRSPIIWGTAAAVLLCAIGLDDLHLRQQLATTQATAAEQRDLLAMLQSPATHLVSLKGMDRMASASGNAVVAPNHSSAIFVLQNLPALPPGQSYCLWTIVDNRKVETGEFRPNSQGQVLIKVPLSEVNRISGFAVTIEPSPTPENPTGPMVMSSK